MHAHARAFSAQGHACALGALTHLPSHKEQKQSIDYSSETWVKGKAEPISLRVPAPLGETMLESNIGWTRRKVLFQKVNRSDGTMALVWKDLGVLPRVAIALTVGSSLGCIALPRLREPTEKGRR